MWHVWRGDRHIERFGGEHDGQGPLDNLEGLGADGKIILARILKNYIVSTLNELIWLGIETSGGLLCTPIRTFWIQKYRELFDS
jgi:hypothetical protein